MLIFSLTAHCNLPSVDIPHNKTLLEFGTLRVWPKSNRTFKWLQTSIVSGNIQSLVLKIILNKNTTFGNDRYTDKHYSERKSECIVKGLKYFPQNVA